MSKRLHIHAVPAALFGLAATFVIATGLYFQQAQTLELGKALVTPSWHVTPTKNGLARITPNEQASSTGNGSLNTASEAGRAISIQMSAESLTTK